MLIQCHGKAVVIAIERRLKLVNHTSIGKNPARGYALKKIAGHGMNNRIDQALTEELDTSNASVVDRDLRVCSDLIIDAGADLLRVTVASIGLDLKLRA